MKKRRIRIGVLGCADIAKRSMLPAILSLPDYYELVAVASRSASKAKIFSEEFGCESICGYQGIVDRSDIDALYIPLPTGLHGEWIEKAILSGKHVYAEKTFAKNSALTRQLVELARERSLGVMEGYMFLYHSQHRLILDLIANGIIGELRHFHGCFGFPPLDNDNFRYDEEIGGGVIMDAAGYPLRAASLFLGDSIKVIGGNLIRDVHSNTSIWGSSYLLNDCGIGASIAFGFDNFYQCHYELWGSLGKITAKRAYTAKPTESPRILIETKNESSCISAEPFNHFVGALMEFYRIITNSMSKNFHYKGIVRQSELLSQIQQLSDLAD
jgi:predicted dehydrogenase